ncbi:hypothetical protein KKF81_04445 [Candidatus Micrarchaeota archaeon]|nr:hypothetical protein [Candidatus Micrarchaeota archaeon]MBU1166175.1 hypothetical protein [Candidatus Micrarchaeota archaeon]MBU1886573.1 hypothetical protein [Candidatus Micrarchaeota archaeon]
MEIQFREQKEVLGVKLNVAVEADIKVRNIEGTDLLRGFLLSVSSSVRH